MQKEGLCSQCKRNRKIAIPKQMLCNGCRRSNERFEETLENYTERLNKYVEKTFKTINKITPYPEEWVNHGEDRQPQIGKRKS